MLKNHWNTYKFRFFGQSTEQTLSNFELWNLEIKTTFRAGADPSCLLKCVWGILESIAVKRNLRKVLFNAKSKPVREIREI